LLCSRCRGCKCKQQDQPH